jgi:hypothetical protein
MTLDDDRVLAFAAHDDRDLVHQALRVRLQIG